MPERRNMRAGTLGGTPITPPSASAEGEANDPHDPSGLTTAAILREIEHLRRLVDTQLTAMDLRYQQRFDASAAAIAAALEAQEKAVAKAETANEKRFESVNEFRQALSDQTKTFISRPEFNAERDANEKRFEMFAEFRLALADATKTYVTRTEFEASRSGDDKRIQEMFQRIDRSEGRGAGLNAGWVYLLGALAAMGTIVSLFVAFTP